VKDARFYNSDVEYYAISGKSSSGVIQRKSDGPNMKIFASRETSLPYLLIAPTIAVLLALSIYPLIYAVKISLQTGSGEAARWTLANFARLASDRFFLEALAHTFIYAAVALTFEFLLGLGLAVLLDRPLRGRSLFRSALLIPMMLRRSWWE